MRLPCLVLKFVYTGEDLRKLGGAVEHLRRGLPLETPVQPAGVVGVDRVRDGGVRGDERREDGIEVKLVLQDPVDAFREGVLVAVVGIGHAGEPPLVGESTEELVTAILAPAVRVMQHAVAGAEGGARLVEGLPRTVMREIAAQMPAHDMAAVHVGREEQIGKPVALEAEIRDVADDSLAGPGDVGVLEPIRRHGVPVPRVRRERAAPFPLDEGVVLAQPRKELIPADRDAGRRQVDLQLPRPDARLGLAFGPDGGQHYGFPRGRVGAAGALLPLVEGVARDPKEGTDGADGEGLLAAAGACGGKPNVFFRSSL